MQKKKFKRGEVVVGNELSNKYSYTIENTLWVVVQYFSYRHFKDDMNIVPYTGPDIEGFRKVKKDWNEDFFYVDAECFDSLDEKNENLLYLLNGGLYE